MPFLPVPGGTPPRRRRLAGVLTAMVLTIVVAAGALSIQAWPRHGHAEPASGSLSFAPLAAYLNGRSPAQVAIGDFNGDGKPDLIATTADNQVCDSSFHCTDYPAAINVLLNNGDGSFTQASGSPITIPTGQSHAYNSVVVGDFNRDGKLDAAVLDAQQNVIYVLLGKGDGTFLPPTPATTISFPSSGPDALYPNFLVAGDFNGDGKLDLATSNGSARTIGSVTVLLGHGDGTFASPDPTPGPGSNTFATGGSSEPNVIVAGDFTGDGKSDLITLNSEIGPCCQPASTGFTTSYSVLRGNGDGTFTLLAGNPVGTSNYATAIAVGDFNGDGKPDLALANNRGSAATSTGLSILLGHGDGTFTETSSSLITFDSYSPSDVETGDFNGDGKSDLVVTTQGGHAEILLGNGDGTFQSPVPFQFGPNYPSNFPAAVGDLNTDGLSDVVVADELGGPAGQVAVLLNTSTFVLPTSTGLGTSPDSPVVGQNVTLSATVSAATAPTGIPTGSVTFQDGVTTLGTATLSGGKATYSTTALTLGTHSITASYGGDARFQPSASTPQTVIVGVHGEDVAGVPAGGSFPPYNLPPQTQSSAGSQNPTANGTGQTQQQQQPAVAHQSRPSPNLSAGPPPWLGTGAGLLLLLVGLGGLAVVYYRASGRPTPGNGAS